jgi:hypothetical protein
MFQAGNESKMNEQLQEDNTAEGIQYSSSYRRCVRDGIHVEKLGLSFL